MSGLLDRAALIVFVGILAARPLIPEVFERFTSGFVADDVAGPTPAASMWLDFLLLVASAAVFWRHGLGGRRGGIVGGALLLLAVAVGLSTWGASDRRVALNAATELLAFAAAGVALTRLVAARGNFAAILAAAAIASAGVNAIKCGTQAAFEFRDTLDAWTARKAQLVEAGRDANDPAIVNFERRLRSADTFGYLSHPNVTASILAAGAALLLGIGLFGLRRGGLRGGAGPLLAVVLVGGLSAALWTTGSAGAAVGLIAGGATACLLLALGKWVTARPAAAASMFLGGQAAILAALLAYGLTRSTLPGASLAFRWEYWTAAGQAYADAPWTGIGRENFAPFHMRFKPASATEEVRNPHNLWVSLLVETGPAGLLAGVLLIAAGVWTVFQRFTPRPSPRDDPPHRSRNRPETAADAPPGSAAGFGLPVLCGVAVLLSQLFFADVPVAAGGVAIVWAIEVAAAWVVLYLGALRLVQGSPEGIRIGSLAAIAALLTHNLIDFSLITPAGLSVMVLLFAAGQRDRTDAPAASSPPGRWRRHCVGALVACVAAGQFFWIARPTQHTTDLARRIDAIFSRPLSAATVAEAYDIGLAAVRDDSFESALPGEIAGKFSNILDQPDIPIETANDIAAKARMLAQLASARDPRSPTARALLARTFDQQAAIAEHPSGTGDARNLRLNAAALWDEAVARYPTNPRWRIDAAAAWLATLADDPDSAKQIRARAAAHLDAALAIDAARPAENASKLSPAERDQIQRLRETIEAGGATSLP